MKTTLKKTMAALSAAAVVAASAAVMAAPVSAASATVSVSSATLTMSELEAANYEVTLTISGSEDVTNAGFGMSLLDGLGYVDCKGSVAAMWAAAQYAEGVGCWVGMAGASATPAGALGTITVTVPETAQPGDVYTVQVDTVSLAGNDAQYANMTTGTSYDVVGSNGTITITEDPTEPTTEPPTEPETTTTTSTPTATPTTTTKKPASSTSSPKTGDALPVAGVAVAVAVIGGVALVAKKRK